MNPVQTIKNTIKHPFKVLARRFGHHTRSFQDPQLLILMYHRILPLHDEKSAIEEPGMIVTPATFKSHLEILSDKFEFTKLSDWIQKRNNGQQLPAFSCAITFDDGWADNYEYAFPALKQLNIPATIFVVSDMMDTNQEFWPERLMQLCTYIASHCPDNWEQPVLEWIAESRTSYCFDKQLPSKEQLSEIIHSSKKRKDSEIHHLIDNAITTLSLNLETVTETKSASLLSWQQIHELTSSGLIEVGSHTCNHTRLNSDISQQEMTQQIVESKNKINQMTAQPVSSFCFPNGDYSDLSLQLVKSNYLCSVTTQSGWNDSHSDPFLLKRIGIHEDIANTKTNFLARISGWGI